MQISHLIMNKIRATKNDEVMLNVLLCGPAGTGKTAISTIIAKIWYALGYLKGAPRVQKQFFDFNHDHNTDTTPYNLFFIILFLWIIALSWTFYTQFGALFTLLLIVTLGVVIVYFMWNTNTTNNIVKNVGKKNIEFEELKDEDVIQIVSRADLIGQYVGSTALKTKKVLEDNIGKVLFIDEAYSIIQSHDDSFGAECLNTLNLFLSQHPNDIIVVMAGYKDLIEQGIFQAQPGLKRRFMWQFDCDLYSSSELFEIFKQKIDQKGYIVDDITKTKKLFDDYM